jgi:hypothetical protein
MLSPDVKVLIPQYQRQHKTNPWTILQWTSRPRLPGHRMENYLAVLKNPPLLPLADAECLHRLVDDDLGLQR